MGSFCTLSRSPRAIPFCRGAKFWAPLTLNVIKGHLCSRTKQNVPFAPSSRPRMLLTELDTREGSSAPHILWAGGWRRASVAGRVGLCKRSAQGSGSAGANCSCKVVGGVLGIYTRLGIPPPLLPESWKCSSHCAESPPRELKAVQILNLAP